MTTPRTIDGGALRLLLGARDPKEVQRWIRARGITPIGRGTRGAWLYLYSDIEHAILNASSTTVPEATPTWIPTGNQTTTINQHHTS